MNSLTLVVFTSLLLGDALRIKPPADKQQKKKPAPCTNELLQSWQNSSVGLERFADMKKVFEAQTEPVVMVINTANLNCYADNFMVHTQKALPGRLVMHFSLDAKSHEWCTAAKEDFKDVLTCLDFSGWVDTDLETKFSENAERGSFTDDSCRYKQLVWTRPALLEHAVRYAKGGVLSMDLDVVLHTGSPLFFQKGDLIAWLQSQRQEGIVMMGSTEDVKHNLPNGGTIWVEKGSESLLEEWNKQFKRGADQEGLHYMLKKNQELTDKIQLIPEQVMGQCAKKGSYGTHYNCIEWDKAQVMKAQKDWEPKGAACQKTPLKQYSATDHNAPLQD